MDQSIKKLGSIEEINKLHSEKKLVGLFEVSNDLYHSGPGISSTSLKRILKSPANYHEKQKVTEALDFGNAFHTAVLEPDKFESEVGIQPKIDRRTKVGKEAYKEFMAENEGKYLIKEDEYETVKLMAKNVLEHPSAAPILKNSHKELSAYAYDPTTKVLMKARSDILFTGERFVFGDLKTIRDTSESYIDREIFNRNYHFSAAYYCYVFSIVLGIEFDEFLWLFCGKSFPYTVEAVSCGPVTMQHATALCHKALTTFKSCSDFNYWPSSSNKIREFEAKPWQMMEFDDDE